MTDKVPLVGADGYEALVDHAGERWPPGLGLGVERIEHLLGRYGTAIREVLDLVAEHPELAEPLEHAPSYLKVEAHYGASHEGALHLDDLLARRMRISIDTWDRGVDVAREVAEIVAPVLGWDAAAIERRGRALPPAGRRRARLAEPARRPDRRRRPARGAGGPVGPERLRPGRHGRGCGRTSIPTRTVTRRRACRKSRGLEAP